MLVSRPTVMGLAAPPSCADLRKILVFQGKEVGTREYPLSKSLDTPDTVSFHHQELNIWHLQATHIQTVQVNPIKGFGIYLKRNYLTP